MVLTRCFLLLSSLFILYPHLNYSQLSIRKDSTRLYYVGLGIKSGSLLAYGTSLPSLQLRNPVSFRIDAGLLKNEQYVWDYANCYIRNGLSFSYTDFGNKQILGKSLNVVLYTEPYLLLEKRWRITLRGGAGISFLDKIYNPTYNPENIYASRKVSYLLFIDPTIYFLLSKQVNLFAGMQISHLSNGGSRWPNWGLNTLSAGAGVEYAWQKQEVQRRAVTPFTKKSWRNITHLFGGSHNSNPIGGQQFKRFVGGINTGMIKPLGKVSSLGIGGELYYDELSNLLKAKAAVRDNPWVASLSLQHYLFLGKLLFGQQMAYYVSPHHPNGNTKFYQRYFLEYNLIRNWYGGVSLRAHGDVSDFLTLTTGYIFAK